LETAFPSLLSSLVPVGGFRTTSSANVSAVWFFPGAHVLQWFSFLVVGESLALANPVFAFSVFPFPVAPLAAFILHSDTTQLTFSERAAVDQIRQLQSRVNLEWTFADI
jgi:hypothetical protein